MIITESEGLKIQQRNSLHWQNGTVENDAENKRDIEIIIIIMKMMMIITMMMM